MEQQFRASVLCDDPSVKLISDMQITVGNINIQNNQASV